MLNLARRHLEPWRWGEAFKELLKAKGITRGKRGPKAVGTITDKVSETAATVGVDERTARRRMKAADEKGALPKPLQAAVEKGEKSLPTNIGPATPKGQGVNTLENQAEPHRPESRNPGFAPQTLAPESTRTARNGPLRAIDRRTEPMPEAQTIRENVAAREAANELHRLALDEATNHQGRAAVEFWRRVLRNVLGIVPEELYPRPAVEAEPPMDETEARRFEREPFPFGLYRGQAVGEIPVDYLCWLDAEPDFRRNLRRYLRSDRGQRLQPDPE